MGINKPDIRYVIHYHIPLDLENYVQEFGRCNRDGKQGIAILLYQRKDLKLQEYLIENSLPTACEIDSYFKSNAKNKALLRQEERYLLIEKYLRNGLSQDEMKNFAANRLVERKKSLAKMRNYAEQRGACANLSVNISEMRFCQRKILLQPLQQRGQFRKDGIAF